MQQKLYINFTFSLDELESAYIQVIDKNYTIN